jgi:hypothetical protein
MWTYWASEDLADKLGITVAQLTGRRANIGRSMKVIAEELGVDPDTYELSQYIWDDEGERWIYRLAVGAHRAIANKQAR